MKYKVGDKVRIIANINHHELAIGNVYVISSTDNDDEACIGYEADGWWFTEVECEAVRLFLTYRSYDEGGEIICLTDTVEEAIDVLCKTRNQPEYERYERPDYTEVMFKNDRKRYDMYIVKPIDKNVYLDIEIGQ